MPNPTLRVRLKSWALYWSSCIMTVWYRTRRSGRSMRAMRKSGGRLRGEIRLRLGYKGRRGKQHRLIIKLMGWILLILLKWCSLKIRHRVMILMRNQSFLSSIRMKAKKVLQIAPNQKGTRTWVCKQLLSTRTISKVETMIQMNLTPKQDLPMSSQIKKMNLQPK